MTTLSKRHALAAVALAAFASAALATPVEERQPAGADRLTEDELKRTFESIDASHDGKIDLAESEKAEALRGAFRRFDLDADGAVTLDEFREEFAIGAVKKGRKVEEAILAKVREARESDAKYALDEKAMATLDGDDNGSLSLEEIASKAPARRKNLAAWIEPLFAAADANRDAQLAAEEWKAFQKALRDWAHAGQAAPPSDKPKSEREPKDKP